MGPKGTTSDSVFQVLRDQRVELNLDECQWFGLYDSDTALVGAGTEYAHYGLKRSGNFDLAHAAKAVFDAYRTFVAST